MLSRREFLTALGSAVVACSWLRQARAAMARAWSLANFARNIQAGGPPKDGIPAIDTPKYISAADAGKFLRNNDIVFGLDYRGMVRAYPQKTLVWHEIVNDEVNGEKISITYCPLTGSVVGFRGQSPEGTMFTFGTSGKLVNSNLLMYDRQTNSQWPQILGMAIDGEAKGAALEEIPLAWTQWSRWRRRHPDSLVLSSDTGYFRSYGRDPYGSYDNPRSYYLSGGPLFPVMAKDDRLSAKEVVIGIKAKGKRMALRRQTVQEKKLSNISLGGVPLVALYDSELDIVRVFTRHINRRPTNFKSENGRIVDELTGSVWTAAGRAVEGKMSGKQLKQDAAYDVMWFAWHAFFPESEVLS